jgi:hypothetical protein
MRADRRVLGQKLDDRLRPEHMGESPYRDQALCLIRVETTARHQDDLHARSNGVRQRSNSLATHAPEIELVAHYPSCLISVKTLPAFCQTTTSTGLLCLCCGEKVSLLVGICSGTGSTTEGQCLRLTRFGSLQVRLLCAGPGSHFGTIIAC